MTDTPTPTILKYIDPMVDFGFKKIFKDSGNKQLLIRPLNAIFGLDIVDITIRDGEQLGLSKEERSSSFDLYCETADRRADDGPSEVRFSGGVALRQAEGGVRQF